MFTGLIQATSHVRECSASRIAIDIPNGSWEDVIRSGESIAVNGCCLTVAETEGALVFDLSEETLRRTTLGTLGEGAKVNLERALRASDRLGF